MTARDRKNRPNCPFWSVSSRKCSLCNGGIFIPLDDHVAAFCTTPHFSACVQYTTHSEMSTSLQENVRKSEENRRKFLRIETSHKITLIKISGSDKTESPSRTYTKTLDVSKGGMRLATEKALLHDMLVKFSFDESFPHILHDVTGQVEWCNKQVDEPGYQVGVSFQGEHIIEAMGQHLGQRQERR
jgi:hypothetical protein